MIGKRNAVIKMRISLGYDLLFVSIQCTSYNVRQRGEGSQIFHLGKFASILSMVLKRLLSLQRIKNKQ